MAEKHCSKCENQLKVDNKHCVKCGAAQQLLQQKIVAEEYKNAQTPSTEACSLCSFREKKQYERAPFFKPAKQAHCRQNRLSKGSSSTPQRRMVLINVGIMERDNYSILKPARGMKLPLKLSETSSASEIKILAIDKTFVALRIMFYCTLMEKKWLHSQKHHLVQERKMENNSDYVNTKWN